MLVVGYLRTSSLTNIGDNKDSQNRQLLAIKAYVKTAGHKLVGSFSDAGVAGSDMVFERDGFESMIDYCLSNNISTIVCESASRFSRDLITQLVGLQYLGKHGISLIAADSPTAFTEDTPTAIMVSQILGAVSQFDKSSLIAKLAGARKRIREKTGKCEGRKSLNELKPQLVRKVLKLRKEGKTLQSIADNVSEAGFRTNTGNNLGSGQIYKMLKIAEKQRFKAL